MSGAQVQAFNSSLTIKLTREPLKPVSLDSLSELQRRPITANACGNGRKFGRVSVRTRWIVKS